MKGSLWQRSYKSWQHSTAKTHTRAWEKEEHENLQRETLQEIDRVIERANQKNNRLIILRDFNCKKVDWRNYEVREEGGDWSWNKERKKERKEERRNKANNTETKRTNKQTRK